MNAVTQHHRILVVEDDADLSKVMAVHLSDVPADVTVAADGCEGAALARDRQAWDAIVLDINLPGVSGLEICRSLRTLGDHVPIMMVTARSAEGDRIQGLEWGADDYLVKPFSVAEMVARVRALLRRASFNRGELDEAAPPDEVIVGPLRVNRLQRRAWAGDCSLTLTPKEFDLLWHFACHPSQVFTRDDLLSTIWGHAHDGYDHTVNTHINRLRTKLKASVAGSDWIRTVWGVGYSFAPLE